MNPNAPSFVPGVGLVYTDDAKAPEKTFPASNQPSSDCSNSKGHDIGEKDACQLRDVPVDTSEPRQSSSSDAVLKDDESQACATPAVAEETETSAPNAATPKSTQENPSIDEAQEKPEGDKAVPAVSGEQNKTLEHVSIIFLGHVDSGKSTTSGQILWQTGMITERVIEKYTKEAVERKHTSWFLSYIMDALEEERSKGKTIEVGRARFLSSKRRYTILDAPGHKNYVPNMLVGLCQADIAILIISARKGEFESGFEKNGQTREHVFLARAMGIRSLIICINKMDDPTVNWSKTRYDELVKKIVPFLQNTRYNIKRDVSIIPISGQLGYNIKTKIDTGVCPWYTGNSLIETLDSLPCSPRDPSAPLRMPILDRIKDMGIIAMGKIEQGTVVKNRQYVVVPGNAEVEITKIETEESVDSVAAGEIAHLTLKIADESQIARGSVICDVKSLVNTATDFVAQVVITDLPSNKVLITSGSAVMLHIHAVVTEASFVRILVELDKKTGEVIKKLPKFARVKSVINVHIQVPTPIPIEVFKEMPQLGRFVIRDEDTTVGFGQVIHLGAPRLKRSN